jgi:hypothetical protein
MPFKSFENPCRLDALRGSSGVGVIMEDVWYRKLTTKICPPRKMGASEISITHISTLCLVDDFQASHNKLLINISGSAFFDELAPFVMGESMLDELARFDCPTIGPVKLQRYWVRSRLKDAEGFLLKPGYQLETSIGESIYNCDKELSFISPILDILSIFCRQRILVHGWEILAGGVRSRLWKDPLDPARTNYVGIEPNCFLVDFSQFSSQVNSAIASYYQLKEDERKSIFKLSYCLSPAISLRDGERFMALFRGLESIAGKTKSSKDLTEDDKLLVNSLTAVAESFQETHPALQQRVEGFIRKISGNDIPLVQKLRILLKCENVSCTDLWDIEGSTGLSGIRHKLAHGGAHAIHHLGLAVATFHLSLIVERFVFSLLGLSLEDRIDRQLRRDEWLQADYVRKVKESIFRVDAEYKL